MRGEKSRGFSSGSDRRDLYVSKGTSRSKQKTSKTFEDF